jgi:hypothetical protein
MVHMCDMWCQDAKTMEHASIDRALVRSFAPEASFISRLRTPSATRQTRGGITRMHAPRLCNGIFEAVDT